MSVRAYRVNRKELADESSFNCWHETDILDFLEGKEFWDGRDDDGCGIIRVSVATLEKLVAEYQWETDDDYCREAIEADIAWAKEHDSHSVEYDCF